MVKHGDGVTQRRTSGRKRDSHLGLCNVAERQWPWELDCPNLPVSRHAFAPGAWFTYGLFQPLGIWPWASHIKSLSLSGFLGNWVRSWMCMHVTNCKWWLTVDAMASVEHQCPAIWNWAFYCYLQNISYPTHPPIPKALHDAYTSTYIFDTYTVHTPTYKKCVYILPRKIERWIWTGETETDTYFQIFPWSHF